MPVDYAEPTKLQNFKVEVFQPRNDTPALTKQAFSPTYETAPGQLSVPNRDSGLGKPNNLPERQNSLRNDGQYRTIDVTPNTTAKPAPSKQLNQLGNGTAGEAAIAEAAYYAGFLIDGVIDGLQSKNFENDSLKLKRTVLEDLSYKTGNMAGKEARDLTEDAIKNSEKLLDDLWRNKPTFEIPQVKIPKFDLPELPDLKIPDFPEFKFPEISSPKPEPPPIPKPKPPQPSLTKQLKDIDMLHCGGASMKIAYVAILTGWREIRDSNGTWLGDQPVYQQSDLKTFIKARIADSPSLANSSIENILENQGQSGFNYFVDETPTLRFKVLPYVLAKASINGNVYIDQSNHAVFRVPYYVAHVETIDIRSGSSVKEVLSYLSQYDTKPEVYYFQTDLPDKIGCSLPLPEPSPPPPPPEDDCCRMGCCPKPTEINYRLIKALVDQTLKEQKFAIKVPICKCEFNKQTNKWTPKTDTVIMEVFATSQLQADQLAQLHLENARQAADLCLARNTEEPIAAIPQSWQIRHEGGKPQMVIHCAEKKEDGKYDSAKYPITVPHWKGKVTDKPSLPPYKKGNWEGILVLADNTKVTINAANEAECTKILNAIKPWINSEMLKGSYFKGGKINVDIKQTQVKAMYGRYFKEGQKNGKPDWRVDFP
jgi:hypothetical protein